MITPREKIVNKFKLLSDKYHKMSLLFYELSQSLNQEFRKYERSPKEIKKYLRENLNMDYDKVMEITKTDLSLRVLKGGLKE